MKPSSFEYCLPKTIEEAFAALDHDDAKIIAGGQSLVPMMNFRLVQPGRLVDINSLPGLGEIVLDGGTMRIGSLVRHAEAARHDLVRNHLPVIAEAMAHVAHVAIRNRGTIGGSLVHADPSAEWPLLVTLLDGQIEIAGPEGLRHAAPQEFFVAPLVTTIEDDEILVAVRLPILSPGTGMAFTEIAQRAGDFAVVAAAATVLMDRGVISDVRLALGGAGDVPVRLFEVEAALAGLRPDAIDAITRGCADGLEPNEDMHATAEYRRSLIPVLARRALEAAVQRAGAMR
ncbi:MAG: xanthine dehydrogenase family protein subunit M [Hoeflea sp.]|uniref:FAD binding domain-containing protein n=1 Tax=Hoeflea sp. TaxID=1940281 RepID=UPI002730DD0A|nr:xanthine dehydrogenase family protein subunit M [Hoeflea sp.]MDP2119202.1 xanthine dehydrogenase family protein subunit M [Hoeflea sp.]